MIRVLHVVGKMHRGGIETLLMEIYRKIDRSKIQFDFIVNTHEVGNYDQEIKKLGGNIYYIPPRTEGIKNNYLEILKICKDNRDIKIVHNHLSSLTYLEPLRAAKNAGIKVRIAHSHNNNMDKSLYRSFLIKFNKLRKNYLCTDYFACSNDAGKWMFGSKWDSNGVLIKNGINSKFFLFNEEKRNEMRKKLDIEKDFVVGFIGRFELQKNPLFLIEIFKEIVKKHPASKLLLVGEGSMHNKMNTKLIEYGLKDYVIYTGVVDDVYNYINAMDSLVQPSIFEGLGIIFIEGQANSLMCFGSDKVPIDAKFSNYYHSISLNSSNKEWADKILEYSINCKRNTNMEQLIKKSHYDISYTKLFLENFYLERGNYDR